MTTEYAIVQDVSSVERSKKPLKEVHHRDAIELLVHAPIEACSHLNRSVVSSEYHPFVAAVHAAFASHRPLVLSPDMLWLLIAQGFARHINENAEELRHCFVGHEGKESIIIRRDDFIKGSPENPWEEVFGEFSRAIRSSIGDENHANIVVSFSTTGIHEQAANEVVLMDSMKNYFEYELFTLCGIPQVLLEGTPEDWHKLYQGTTRLGAAYGVDWWTERLAPVLTRIAENASGADDAELWKDIYKWEDGSGGPYINGWIIDFFPYLQAGSNSYIQNQSLSVKPSMRHGLTANVFPGSMSKAPFKWEYLGRSLDMELMAGFTSFTQDSETMAVRPCVGWAVREKQRPHEDAE